MIGAGGSDSWAILLVSVMVKLLIPGVGPLTSINACVVTTLRAIEGNADILGGDFGNLEPELLLEVGWKAIGKRSNTCERPVTGRAGRGKEERRKVPKR